jgi:hypothetical protein
MKGACGKTILYGRSTEQRRSVYLMAARKQREREKGRGKSFNILFHNTLSMTCLPSVKLNFLNVPPPPNNTTGGDKALRAIRDQTIAKTTTLCPLKQSFLPSSLPSSLPPSLPPSLLPSLPAFSFPSFKTGSLHVA